MVCQQIEVEFLTASYKQPKSPDISLESFGPTTY